MPLINGEVALISSARGSGTYTSGVIAVPGTTYCLILVLVTAVSGVPTLDVALEQSATGGGSWTSLGGSGIVQLAGIGNGIGQALVTSNYVRVTASVAGVTPNMTFGAIILYFGV
jgi:hypothetical protein